MDSFKWPDMPFEKEPQSTLINRDNDDYGEAHLSNENIYEYLKFCHKHEPYKLAGIITNKQRLFNIAKQSDHWSLLEEILKKTFPKRKYDWYNHYDDGVIIFAVGKNEIVIDLPPNLSQIQYESVLKILDQIHQFEIDFDTKIEFFNSEYILEEAEKRLSNTKAYNSDEVVVGIPLAEELPKELFKEESKDKDDWSIYDNDVKSDLNAWQVSDDDEIQINEYIEKKPIFLDLPEEIKPFAIENSLDKDSNSHENYKNQL